MILRYRVSLAGIKGFFRVYELKSDMTLFDFHKVMRDEMEFPHDQLIQFKALDEAGGLVGRYAMFDLGFGTVDKVTLGDTFRKGVVSFLYFYDVTNKKSVILTCEGEVAPKPGLAYPALVDTKGPNPVEFENGYVAYEDLPEDHKHLPGEEDDDDEPDYDDEDQDDALEVDEAGDDDSWAGNL